MVTRPLVEIDRKLGEDVWRVLAADPQLGLRAAYWWFSGDADRWFYVIAATDCEIRGPKAAYLRVRTILETSALHGKLPLSRIALTVPGDPVILHLRNVVDGPKQTPMNVYLENIGLFGFEILGAYVYQI